MIPVFIPSKGRPNCPTSKLIPNASIVVEPQDYEAYEREHPGKQIFVLHENNKGLAYSRNAILKIAEENELPWIWMIDDDIKSFVTYISGKENAVPWAVIAKNIDPFLLGSNYGQASLDYSQFAWSSGGKLRYNGYCDVCVAVNMENLNGAHYRDHVIMKEDRDFSMQLLRNGYENIRFTKYAFCSPKNGSNKGGLYDLYKQDGREEIAVQRMIELWGVDVCERHVKKDGRVDVKINWKKVARIRDGET